LRKLERAVAYAQSPTDLNGKLEPQPIGPIDGQVSANPSDVIEGKGYASIKTRSSVDLSLIPSDRVHIILTDPPYFDNVSYSELSDFYLAWRQRLQDLEPPYNDASVSAPIYENLAVANRSEDSLERYGDELTTIFCECARVLMNEGVIVFTYHHKAAIAWLLLGQALHRSGLSPTSVLPMRGEGQSGLHSQPGTIKWDAVFVCRKGIPKVSNDVTLFVTSDSIDAAGSTLQEYIQLFDKELEVDFRPPDQLNLFRALVVTHATPNRGAAQTIPLYEALCLSLDKLPIGGV
jgi:hypothetical protein